MVNKKSVLLELSGSCVRALLLQKKDKQFAILKAKVFPVEPDKGITGALTALFLEFPKEKITVLFPREKCVFRELEPKEKTPAALKETAEHEAEEGLPFGRENAVLDYSFYKEKQAGILAAASCRDIDIFSGELMQLKAPPVSMVPTTFALFEAFRHSKEYTKEPSLLVFSNGERADIIACREGTIILSRGLEIRDGKLEEEVKLTLKALEKDKKIITGVFTSGIEIKNGIKLSLPGDFSQKTGLENISQDWFLLYGLFLAVTEKDMLILDLLKHVSGKKEGAPIYIKLLQMAAAACAAILVFSGIIYFLNNLASNELEDIKTELSGLEVQGGRKWAAAVSEIMNAVPDEVILNEMSGDNKGEINLKGTAKARKDITVFMDSLNRIRGLASELAFANELATGSGPVTQFMVKIRVKAVVK